MPTEHEIEVVKNSTAADFGMFAYFILYTGLRRGEALALRYEDIDFNKKVIHVRRSAYWMGNSPHIKEPKTEAGTRDVFLLDNLAAHIDRSGSGYIFRGKGGGVMTNSWYQCRWAAYLKETGLNITAHQLRHAYAGVLFDAGLDVKDAQDLMGHANISVTRDIYTQISKTHKENTMNKLNAFVNQNT
jgi:integrase